MSVARIFVPSLRLDRLESSRLAWAFAISLAAHLLVWGCYTGGKKLGVWERAHLPAWVKTITQTLAKVVKKEETPKQPDPEPPLMFVDVSPRQATAKPPKNAAFYSDKNSQAANPDADKDTGVPKITGKQTQIIKTEDVPRTKAFPLQPAPTPPLVEPVEPVKVKPAVTPGDLALAKPEEMVRKDDGQGKESRPRTIKEALARQQPYTALAGEKMKQDGGVRRRATDSSLDARATPFGAYDAAIIAAIQNRWYYLLDTRNFAQFFPQ